MNTNKNSIFAYPLFTYNQAAIVLGVFLFLGLAGVWQFKSLWQPLVVEAKQFVFGGGTSGKVLGAQTGLTYEEALRQARAELGTSTVTQSSADIDRTLSDLDPNFGGRVMGAITTEDPSVYLSDESLNKILIKQAPPGADQAIIRNKYAAAITDLNYKYNPLIVMAVISTMDTEKISSIAASLSTEQAVLKNIVVPAGFEKYHRQRILLSNSIMELAEFLTNPNSTNNVDPTKVDQVQQAMQESADKIEQQWGVVL